MSEVSAAIFIDGNKALCFKRGISKYPYLSYKYEFPGGKLEVGETPKEAIIRELREELDIDLDSSDVNEFLDTIHEYPDFTVTMHFFIIEYVPDYVLKEHSDAIWVESGLLSQVDLAEADKDVIESLEEYLG